MPTLLLPLLLIIFLTLSSAQEQLKLVNNVTTVNLTVPINDTVTYGINLAAVNATLRLDWTATNLTAFSSTLFFLSNKSDSPIRTQGNSLDYNPQASNYTCSRAHPCATVSSIDFAAFYTRSARSFLRFPASASSVKRLFVTVYNYDTAVQPSPHPPPPENLTGVLSARLINDPSKDCPGGPSPSDPVCTNHGKCNNRRCQCDKPFNGTACEREVIQLPAVNEPPNGTFPKEPPPEAYTARVDLFSSVVFSAIQQREEELMVFNITILRGFIKDLNDETSARAPQLVIFGAPPTFGEPFLKQNVTLPTLRNKNFVFLTEENSILFDRSVKNVGEVIYLAVYAFPSNDDIIDGSGLVSINLTTCSRDRCDPRASNVTLELALVPAFLVTTAVAGIGVLVMLYLDRRHSFTNSIDRLSEDEIERMYPKDEYSGGALECSICLCEMEGGDVVRKLHCSHTYHSECLDPWLTANRASCPTCRTEVRIEHLSDKRHMRRVVQFFLAPIVSLRRFRERRRGPDLVEDSPPDVEAGNAGRTLVPESNNENNDGSNNDRENSETITS